MRTLTIVGVGCALLAATAALAVAHDVEAARAAIRQAVEDAFAEADADHSGGLDLAEFGAFRDALRARMTAHRFARADKDSDGALTLEELRDAWPRRGRRPGL